MAKTAPVKATGGGGYSFEDQCAAYYSVELLSGRQSLGNDVGTIIRLDFQAKESGWFFDDLVLGFTSPVGDRSFAMSIKSNRQVTRNGFPTDFVTDAWKHWFGTDGCPFRRNVDLLGLVVGKMAAGVREAWDELLGQARSGNPERVASRFTAPAETSKVARDVFASLRCPSELHRLGEHGDATTVLLAKHIRLLHFDFQAQPSNYEADAHQRCRTLLESGCSDEATRLWKRLVAIASEQRPVGGTLNLPKLLDLLRPEFRLKDHPDYEADWRRLRDRSQERIQDVRCFVGEGLQLDRSAQCMSIIDSACPIVAIVGESGVGKSALARMIAEQPGAFGKVVWLAGDSLDWPDEIGVRQHLGLSGSLAHVLATCSSNKALLILDGIDRFSANALKRAARLVSELRLSEAHASGVWRVVVTSDSRGWQLFLHEFATVRLDVTVAKVEPVSYPEPREIDHLLSQMPFLRGAINRRELKALLRNLKILDFVATAHQGAEQAGPSWVTESDVLKWLWTYWAGSDSQRHGRSKLLQRIAGEEGSGLNTSIPLDSLDQGEAQSLGDLEQRHILREHEGRISFTHDLIGDIARLHTLIGADDFVQAISDHSLQLRWQKAIRLYSLWLLEQPIDGVSRWQDAIARFSQDDNASALARDLLLEGPVFSVKADWLLEQVWPLLVGDNAILLFRLCRTFLHSCTFPDPQIASLVEKPSDVGLYAAYMRLPYGPYWLSVLRLLHRHVGDVVSRPGLFEGVAKICSLWLRTVPVELSPGRKYPGRIEAATLALKMAREVQCLKVERVHFPDDVEKHVYEAALLGAPDLSDDVSQLALELAERREPSGEVQTRAESYRFKEAERLRTLANDPEHMTRLARIPHVGLGPVTRGQKREPWLDGPRERVDNAFQEVCLENAVAFQAFIRVRPIIAKEVLLAVCIEPPGHEDPYDSDLLDRCGTESFRSACPGMFFQGPFLAFLRAQPEDGLDAIIRLVNFATQRWVSVEHDRARYWGQEEAPIGLELNVHVNRTPMRWSGDHRVYGWYRNPLISTDLVTSALMALEKWLYDEVDAGHDLEPWVETILSRSESVAFAGVLVAVGLRTPSLFERPLLPLLGIWQLYEWHNYLRFNETVLQFEMMSWIRLGERIYNLVREWHLLPHRKESLADRAVFLMLTRPVIAEFFVQARQCWEQERENSPYRDSLDVLIARFNPENYRLVEQPNGTVVVQLEWPEPIRERTEAALRESQQSLTVMNFPVHCRMILDGEKDHSDADVDAFWGQLQAISGMTLDDEHEEVFDYVKSSVCGGVAVLFTNHAEWLAKDPEKLAWCHEQLMAVIESPPPRSELELAESPNTLRWDGFVAEALVAILSIDPSQRSVRSYLAAFVTGFYYSTTGLAMKAAFNLRDQLGGDFVRLQNLAVMWSGLRCITERASVLKLGRTRWDRWRQHLIEAFGDRSIGDSPVSWTRLGRIAGLAIRRIEKNRRPLFNWEHAEPDETADTSSSSRDTGRRRRTRLHPGHDIQLLQHAFDWLPNLDQASGACERASWIRLLRNGLGVTLSMLNPHPTNEGDEPEVDGTPYQYDCWLLQKVAEATAQMEPCEHPEQLWQLVLDLGPAAHYWISHFLADWFTHGIRCVESPTRFIERWKEMLEYAATADQWNEGNRLGHRLADLWIELMGLGWHSSALDNGDYPKLIRSLTEQFRLFADRWLRVPHIASAFAAFLARPAGESLRLGGIKWLNGAVQEFHAYDWRDDQLENNLVEALRATWVVESTRIHSDDELRGAFLALLGKLMERQNAAAYVLRDEVLRLAAY